MAWAPRREGWPGVRPQPQISVWSCRLPLLSVSRRADAHISYRCVCSQKYLDPGDQSGASTPPAYDSQGPPEAHRLLTVHRGPAACDREGLGCAGL